MKIYCTRLQQASRTKMNKERSLKKISTRIRTWNFKESLNVWWLNSQDVAKIHIPKAIKCQSTSRLTRREVQTKYYCTSTTVHAQLVLPSLKYHFHISEKKQEKKNKCNLKDVAVYKRVRLTSHLQVDITVCEKWRELRTTANSVKPLTEAVKHVQADVTGRNSDTRAGGAASKRNHPWRQVTVSFISINDTVTCPPGQGKTGI